MKCTEVAPLLGACLDGELDAARRQAIADHLAACPACCRTSVAFGALDRALAPRRLAPRAPAGLAESVETLLFAPRHAGWRRWLGSPAAIAAPGVLALALATWSLLAPAPPAPAAVRVVFHISESEGAANALRNLGNHLQAAPEARVVVVAHNSGVDFLLQGATDAAGEPFEQTVRRYRERGVTFRICRNTLERRAIPDAQVIDAAEIVPSGIAEIGRLQAREGFVYMRL
jgi:intracellular sulfur oxidation DsrE/DsrF family protein